MVYSEQTALSANLSGGNTVCFWDQQLLLGAQKLMPKFLMNKK